MEYLEFLSQPEICALFIFRFFMFTLVFPVCWLVSQNSAPERFIANQSPFMNYGTETQIREAIKEAIEDEVRWQVREEVRKVKALCHQCSE